MKKIDPKKEHNNRFYRIWVGVKRRCLNKNTIDYKTYGKEGVMVCVKWMSFDGFREDMLTSYKKHITKYGEKDTTIDRINVKGNYCKKNCRWATRLQQAQNRRTKFDKTFNPKGIYNISQMIELDLFGVRSHKTILGIIYKDLAGKNTLRAKFGGVGNGTRYKIKGSNIIKYLKN